MSPTSYQAALPRSWLKPVYAESPGLSNAHPDGPLQGTTLGVLRLTARLVDPPRPIMKRSLDGPAISILRCDRTQAFGHPRRHIQELVPGNSLEQTFSLAPCELRLKRTGQRIIVNQHVDPCRGGHS